MKLSEANIEDFVTALGTERSAWVMNAKNEGRQFTDPELTTICMLAALERILKAVAGKQHHAAK